MRSITRTVLMAAAVVAASASAWAEGAAFTLDKVHSNVVFKIGHMGVANMYGMIHAPEGTYSLDFASPSSSKLEIKVLTENIDTGNEGRDRHLKSPDFFDTKQFPEISFVGKQFEKTGEKTMKVTGELTMLGKTQPVVATLSFVGEGETKQGFKSGFEAQFTIKRSEFGMTKYLEGNALSDEVSLMVAVEGKKD